MKSETLMDLVNEAAYLGGKAHPCVAFGHDWQMEGGRPCPYFSDSCDGCSHHSQTVYKCARCGSYDHGETGGPSHRECLIEGPCDWRFNPSQTEREAAGG